MAHEFLAGKNNSHKPIVTNTWIVAWRPISITLFQAGFVVIRVHSSSILVPFSLHEHRLDVAVVAMQQRVTWSRVHILLQVGNIVGRP
jgi:hypothetical protein